VTPLKLKPSIQIARKKSNTILVCCPRERLVLLLEPFAKTHYAQTWHQSSVSSVARYQPLHPEYVLAPYLSAVKGFKSRKLISRFRCGCHGLHIDTGRLLPLAQQVPTEQRHCVFCASGSAEDEHHFVFDCPAYCAIRSRFFNSFPYTVFLLYPS